jgi:hypothetical protein
MIEMSNEAVIIISIMLGTASLGILVAGVKFLIKISKEF